MNPSRKAKTLLRASGPAGSRVELHRSWIENGVARMARLDTLEIPPRASLVLAPGGHHLMLFDVEGLEPGGQLSLRLEFDGGRVLEVLAAVRPAGSAAGHGHAH